MTDIEKIIYDFLKAERLKFKREYKLDFYHVDFYLPDYKLSIQCDGCYHHFHKKCCKSFKGNNRNIGQPYRDRACVNYHKYHHLNIIRIWGCDIHKRLELVKKTILSALAKIKNGEKIYIMGDLENG